MLSSVPRCFATVEFGNRALDRFDGAVLVYRLDVHGDDLAGIHVQKIFQKLVADVGGRDAQKTGAGRFRPFGTSGNF